MAFLWWMGVLVVVGGGWVAARQGRQDLHMASGISSTRQAATRICLCELVGGEGPAPAAAQSATVLRNVVALVIIVSFFFLLFFFNFLSPPYFSLFMLPGVANHHLSELRRVAVRLIPFFSILRFQQKRSYTWLRLGVASFA